MIEEACILRVPTQHDVVALAEVHLSAWLDAYRDICPRAWLDSLTRQTFEAYHRPRLTPSPDTRVVPDPAEPFVVACHRTMPQRVIGFARGGATRAKTPTDDPLPPHLIAPFSAELYAIYVHPSHQHRGAGQALFHGCVIKLRELGHRNLCVWVLNENTRARRFYEKLGGQAAGNAPINLGGQHYEQTMYGWQDLGVLLTPGR